MSLQSNKTSSASNNVQPAKSTSNMYANAKTWNPFKGCEFDCVYCVPSFQLQSKRQKQNCLKCYSYTPHAHPERLSLSQIPSSDIVFVCGNSDLSFCKPEFIPQIIEAIKSKSDNRRRAGKNVQTFFLQSKQPECFKPFLSTLPENVILVTTLETNRDKDYAKYSKAPPPSKRYKQFLALDYPRKIVTIEPVMDFDVDIFSDSICRINPEYVWLGFNSRDKQVHLPEPTPEKMEAFAKAVSSQGIKIKGKHLRGLKLTGVEVTQG